MDSSSSRLSLEVVSHSTSYGGDEAVAFPGPVTPPDPGIVPEDDRCFFNVAELEHSMTISIADDAAAQNSTAPENEIDAEAQKEKDVVTVCGHPVHLTLVRSYYAAGVQWKDHSLATSFFGLFYRDRTVSDMFLVFYKRSFVTLFVCVLYAAGLVLGGTVPLFTRKHMYMWLGAVVVLLLCMAVDGWIHLFAELTPFYAKARMGVGLVLCVVLVGVATWPTWSAQANCTEAFQFPHYPGRKIFATDADLLQHCRTFIETIPIITPFATVGVSLHPVAYITLLALFAFLNMYVGRVYADVHEATSEQLVKFGSIVLVSGATAALSVLRFFATRAAFEATVRIEAQRQETARRAAELEHLLTTIVPAAVLPRLLEGGEEQFTIDGVECASMLFADMKGFTAWSSSRSAVQVTSMLNTVVAALDAIASAATGVEKVKTVGDAYWAVSGIPVESESHADRLVVFAWHMNAIVAELNRSHAEWDSVAWRVAVHSGPMTGALFGERQVSYEVFGETAQIAQVVEANGVPGGLCVTQAVLDAMFQPPSGLEPRLHRSLVGVLPHDQVLDVFELPPPSTDTTESPRAAAAVLAAQSPRSRQSFVLSTTTSPQRTASAATSRRGSTCSLSLTSTAKRRIAYRHVSPRNAGRRRSLPRLSDGAPSESHTSQKNRDEINDAAAAEMERPRWRFLPWFADVQLEAAFKARCEVVTRPHARAAAIMSITAHAFSMAVGFGEAEPCYTLPSIAMQSAAALGFVCVFALTLHPKGSLVLAAAINFLAMAVSVVGLGVAALGECYFAHDVMWLCLFLVIPQPFAIGPISWPVFAICTWLSLMLPGLTLSMLHSPTGPSNSILCSIGVGFFSVCLAGVEEGSLRRRFVEEELSQRCERQLQALGEERVMVLERLVPKHVVQDLIAWFGTGMDPLRSIARTYDRVIVAFLQLRPEASSALARLHADIDRDLDAANRDAASLIAASGASAIPALLLDKIKTVGDVVMVAGPFAHHHMGHAARTHDLTLDPIPSTDSDESEASAVISVASSATLQQEVAAAFSAVVALARSVQPRCPLRLGAHLGPVVGTVQGSSRLAFDTFGDAVNVASRVMSSAPVDTSSGALRVSSDLHDAMVASHVEVPFGEPVTVEAKGKGDLLVFPFFLHP